MIDFHIKNDSTVEQVNGDKKQAAFEQFKEIPELEAYLYLFQLSCAIWYSIIRFFVFAFQKHYNSLNCATTGNNNNTGKLVYTHTHIRHITQKQSRIDQIHIPLIFKDIRCLAYLLWWIDWLIGSLQRET